jgi:tetratricopeptide (TPR) repeat protein
VNKSTIKLARHIYPESYFRSLGNTFPIKIISSLRNVSPIFLGIFLFSILYIRLCSNTGDVEGNNYFEQGNIEAALDSYNEYLMLYPNDAKTLYNRGRCLELQGNITMAKEDYNQVLDLDPENVKALLSLSQLYYAEGNYRLAITLCKSAVQLDDQNYLAHYFLARAYHKYGDQLHALNSYNATIDINPNFGFAYYQRSSLMFSIGLDPCGCYDLKMADTLKVAGASQALKLYCH